MPDGRVIAVYGALALAVVLALVAVGGSVLVGVDRETAISAYLVTNVAIGVSAAPCGFLIGRARPSSPIGWLFLGLGCAPLLTAAMVPLMTYGDEADWPEPVMRLVVTVSSFAWGWGVFFCLPLALQLFPTGTPVGPWWRGLGWLTLVMALIGTTSTGPTPEYGASSYLVSPWWEIGESVAGVLAPVVVLLSVGSVFVRFARGDEVIRQQLLWLVVAVLLLVMVNVGSWFSLPAGREILLLLTFPLVPVAVTIAVLRHGLFDVRLVLSRLLLYGLLSAGVVAAYIGIVALLDRVLDAAGAPVVATLAVALAFNSVRLWLQHLIERAFYGARRDPVRAVSVVGQRLAGDDLGDVLATMRETLRLPYAAIESRQGRLASRGELVDDLHVVPLVHSGAEVGRLVVGVRRGERKLSGSDVAVLGLLATPLAVALELEASRDRLLTATVEERRRLHRELHDSLGPVLTGAAFKADGAALAARTNPETAEALATQLAAQLREAIADARRLVYGLRPDALDQVGLVAALRQRASELGLDMLTVETPDSLPELSAKVEVAAFRIASEALTNVVRHTTARKAVITLTADSSLLTVTVTDDGESRDAWAPGVGLQSIQARAAEVGGASEAGPTPRGGRVAAMLPLRGAS